MTGVKLFIFIILASSYFSVGSTSPIVSSPQ